MPQLEYITRHGGCQPRNSTLFSWALGGRFVHCREPRHFEPGLIHRVHNDLAPWRECGGLETAGTAVWALPGDKDSVLLSGRYSGSWSPIICGENRKTALCYSSFQCFLSPYCGGEDRRPDLTRGGIFGAPTWLLLDYRRRRMPNPTSPTSPLNIATMLPGSGIGIEVCVISKM